MYCERCKVTVNCKADRCPLCHRELTGSDENAEQIFPKGKIRKQRLDIFSKIYLSCALIAVIACIVVNVLNNSEFMWSMIVMVSLIYVYYCIRFTFIAQGNFNVRIFGQAIAQTVVFFAVRLTVGGNHFIFITWLPVVYFVSEVLLCAYIGINWKEARKKMMSLVVMGILGIIPVCAAYLMDLSVKWPSIAASAFSVAVILVTVIAGRKHIIGELKRYFHL